MNFASELFLGAFGVIMSIVIISEIVAIILHKAFGGEK